jgi:K+:H+ antiporter
MRRDARLVHAGISLARRNQAGPDSAFPGHRSLDLVDQDRAAIVRNMNFTRRNLGQVIVASAIMEDTIGWIIIAITFALAEAGTIDIGSVAESVIGTAAFLIVSFTIGRRIVFYCIRWANDHFESEFPVITTILVIMGAMALTTHFIGVHTVLGAFVSGVLIGESPILTKHIDERLRGLIMAFFMPVFFCGRTEHRPYNPQRPHGFSSWPLA